MCLHILTDMIWRVADTIFKKADTIHGVANTMLSVAVMMHYTYMVNLMGRPGSAGIKIFKKFK